MLNVYFWVNQRDWTIYFCLRSPSFVMKRCWSGRSCWGGTLRRTRRVRGCWSLACKEWKQAHRHKARRGKRRNERHRVEKEKTQIENNVAKAARLNDSATSSRHGVSAKLYMRHANCNIPAFPLPSITIETRKRDKPQIRIHSSENDTQTGKKGWPALSFSESHSSFVNSRNISAERREEERETGGDGGGWWGDMGEEIKDHLDHPTVRWVFTSWVGLKVKMARYFLWSSLRSSQRARREVVEFFFFLFLFLCHKKKRCSTGLH